MQYVIPVRRFFQSEFSRQCDLYQDLVSSLFLRASSSCIYFPRLSVLSIFPSVTCCRRQFLSKMCLVYPSIYLGYSFPPSLHVIFLFYTTTQLANLSGHILRRNCLVKHIIEGKIEGRIEATGRRVRRRKKPLGELQEERGHPKLKEKALDRTL